MAHRNAQQSTVKQVGHGKGEHEAGQPAEQHRCETLMGRHCNAVEEQHDIGAFAHHRKADNGGCSNTMPLTGNGPPGSPLPNQVQYAYSHDMGQTWSAPITVAAPPNARAFWPWLVAGEAGTINIVWYQSDKLVDLDCQAAKISIKSSTIQNADTANPAMTTVDAVGQPIHDNGVCQGGTTCVVTGQDRRLGDFFTNALDPRGCVLIASGDTRITDPLTGADYPTARPIFLRQNAGPALIGKNTCS